MYNAPFGGNPLFFIGWIVLFVLVIWLIAKRWNTGDRSPRESPMDILKRRFANGEITKEEYMERRNLLKQED